MVMIMVSFVIDWSFPSTCTSAIRLTKKVTVLNGGMPLMDDDLNEVFKAAKSGMKIILQDKTKWSGTIESKWGKYFGRD